MADRAAVWGAAERVLVKAKRRCVSTDLDEYEALAAEAVRLLSTHILCGHGYHQDIAAFLDRYALPGETS